MNAPARAIPLVDLRAAFLPIRDEVLQQFSEILADMNLLLGRNVQSFEDEFSSYCEVPHGIGVSSGTDALFSALLASGVGPGSEVVVPSHTFFATVEAVVHTGATPVLVDVEPETLTIDPAQVREAITEATRAIVPVHLYGHPADMDPISEIAREYGLRVIEDAAQAHGARYKGRRCGSIGDAGCFSFYFTKNLGALGEGGFVTTSDADIAEKVRLLRHHGHRSKSEHEICGYNLRLDELQAAVLRIKLRTLDIALERRREIAARYDTWFEDTLVRTPSARQDSEHVYHLYPIRVAERDALIVHLAERGIETGVHYRSPAHLQPALRRQRHRRLKLDVTEAACRQLVSLPMYPELTGEQIDFVASSVVDFLKSRDSGAGARAGSA